MRGHEALADRDVLAAGALERHHVPAGMVDLVVAHRHRALEILRRAAGIVRHQHAQQRKAGVIAAAGEGPAAVADFDATGHLGDGASRHERRAGLGVLVFAPDVFLRPRREVAQIKVVDGQDGQHPGAGTAAAAADLTRDFEQRVHVVLVAAKALRLQDAVKAGIAKIGKAVVRQAAQALAFQRARGDHRGQVAGAADQFLGGRDGWRQHSKLHLFKDLTKCHGIARQLKLARVA